MRRLESIEDQMNGVVTVELDDGKRVRVNERTYREVGLGGVRRFLGLNESPTRLPVSQAGRQIGTLPEDYDPLFHKSKSWLYDPRPGDLVREGDRWIAAAALGPGDLSAVPGFVWDERDAKHKERLREDTLAPFRS